MGNAKQADRDVAAATRYFSSFALAKERAAASRVPMRFEFAVRDVTHDALPQAAIPGLKGLELRAARECASPRTERDGGASSERACRESEGRSPRIN